MTSEGYKKIKAEFEPVLKFFDIKPSGNFFKDIGLLAEAVAKADIDEKLTKYFFHCYDKDGNGTISKDELKTLVQDIGAALDDKELMEITDEEINNAMKMLDEDGSGEIEWNEFKAWFDELLKDDEE